MKESDWKLFKKVKAKALERYCTEALSVVDDVVKTTGDSAHDRYLNVYRYIQNADKKLGRIFDGHSRSRATLQLMLLRSEGLVTETELEGMSDEFIEATTPLD